MVEQAALLDRAGDRVHLDARRAAVPSTVVPVRTTGSWQMSCSRSSSIASATVWSQPTATTFGISPRALGDDGADPGRLREAREEAVFPHPVVAVELREISASAVGQEHDDQRVGIVDLRAPLAARPRPPGRPSRR